MGNFCSREKLLKIENKIKDKITEEFKQHFFCYLNPCENKNCNKVHIERKKSVKN